MSEGPPAWEDQVSALYERRASWGAKLGYLAWFLGSLVVGVGWLFLLVPTRDLLFAATNSRSAVGVTSLTLTGLSLLPLLGCCYLVVRFAQTYGSARWSAYGVLVRSPLTFGGERLLPWSALRSVGLCRGGVRITTDRLRRVPEALVFCLIPTLPEERERVLSEVAARAGLQAEEATYGSAKTFGPVYLAVVLWLVVWFASFGLCALATERYWGQEVSGGEFAWVTFLSLAAVGLGWALYSSGFGLVDVFPSADPQPFLCLRGQPVELSAVEAAGGAGRAVWLRGRSGSGSREWRFRFAFSEEVVDFLALLEAAGVPTREDLPYAQRALPRALAVATAVALLLALSLAPALRAWSAPLEFSTHLADSFKQRAILVGEVGTGRVPHLILWSGDEVIRAEGLRHVRGEHYTRSFGDGVPYSGLKIDFSARTWRDPRLREEGTLARVMSAQVAAVGSGVRLEPLPDVDLSGLHEAATTSEGFLQLSILGVPTGPVPFASDSQFSLPTYLERKLGSLPPGPLRDFVSGRSSQRFYHFQGPPHDPEQWVAGVSHGSVLWVAIVPKGQRVRLVGRTMGFQLGRSRRGAELQVPAGVWRMGLEGELSRTSLEVPSLDELREVRRRIEGGATSEEVLASLKKAP